MVLREISRLVPLFLFVLAIAIGTRFTAESAVNTMAKNIAHQISNSWSQNLVNNISNIEDIIQGKQIVKFEQAKDIANYLPDEIQSYRIFDKEGNLRFASESEELTFENFPAIRGKINLPLNEIIKEQHYYRKIVLDGETNLKFGARTIVPLIKNNQTLGYVDILILESPILNMFRRQFSDISFKFIILMLATFLLPAILYLRRTAQLENTSKRLRYNAEYDDLTNVLNRGAFTKKIINELKIASERGYAIAIHYIDLDRFKEINDIRGHEAGDEILIQSAKRLQSLLSPRDGIARLGGDEFVIFQPYFIGSSSSANKLASEIVELLSKPFNIGDCNILLGASVGTSHFPRDGEEIDELLRTADLALYQAKEKGRNRALEFDISMENERQSRQMIEQLLRGALENNRFYLNFQPFYDMKSGKLRGFEALLRLNDKNGNPISPALFIPIAEEIGMIGEIGKWVLEEACNIAKNWPQNIIVSVNLSPEQFQTHNMPELVEEILSKTGLNAKQLELEVTEGLLITDSDKILKDLTKLKQLGVALALDDFGTGYSSLSYLWQFPFDKLKVDKSFINRLDVVDSKSPEILSTIIALGKVLNLKVTAEGVETEKQEQLLRSYNCDLIQGFLYSRPLEAVDVAAEIIKLAKIENLQPARKKHQKFAKK